MKNQKIVRVQDTIHGLIKFDPNQSGVAGQIDALAWDLIQCKEFQRLRRIKQLGFSDYVYPNATHSRLAHCIGVFNNARKLVKVIEREKGKIDDNRALVSTTAALLHDLGHGPFSHAFEGALKLVYDEEVKVAANKAEKDKITKHENWTKAIIEGDTEINSILTQVHKGFPDEVSKVFKEQTDIYSSIVSSQFDADRLDYLVRDRYMTGIDEIHFDNEWLLDCIEIDDKIPINPPEGEDKAVSFVEGFVVNSKGVNAAESFLHSRYKLYQIVAHHKTSRSAEKMMQSLIFRLTKLISEDKLNFTGLIPQNKLVCFLSKETPQLEDYLALDDTILWSSLVYMQSASDSILAELSIRILNRKLFKCFDTERYFTEGSTDRLRFIDKVNNEDSFQKHETILEDKFRFSAYSPWDEGKSAISSIMVRDEVSGGLVDIGRNSPIVRALNEMAKTQRVRYFVSSDEEKKRLIAMAKN